MRPFPVAGHDEKAGRTSEKEIPRKNYTEASPSQTRSVDSIRRLVHNQVPLGRGIEFGKANRAKILFTVFRQLRVEGTLPLCSRQDRLPCLVAA